MGLAFHVVRSCSFGIYSRLYTFGDCASFEAESNASLDAEISSSEEGMIDTSSNDTEVDDEDGDTKTRKRGGQEGP